MDRLGQLLALRRRPWCARRRVPSSSLLGDEVDRTDPLALGGQPFERRRLPRRRCAISSASKPSLSGRRWRHGTRTCSTAARANSALRRLLRLGPRSRAGAASRGPRPSARWPRRRRAAAAATASLGARARRPTLRRSSTWLSVIGVLELADAAHRARPVRSRSSRALRGLLRLPLDLPRASRCSASAWRLRHSSCSRPAARRARGPRSFARPGRRFGTLVGDGRSRRSRGRPRSSHIAARAPPDRAVRQAPARPPRPLRAAASSTGSRSAGRCSSPARWASIRSIAAAAASSPAPGVARLALGGERRRRAPRRRPAAAAPSRPASRRALRAASSTAASSPGSSSPAARVG